jgi:hypothetical protein
MEKGRDRRGEEGTRFIAEQDTRPINSIILQQHSGSFRPKDQERDNYCSARSITKPDLNCSIQQNRSEATGSTTKLDVSRPNQQNRGEAIGTS